MTSLPKPTRHLSLVPTPKPQPTALDAWGKEITIDDFVCLLARQYSRKQQDEVWRVEALASDKGLVIVSPIRGLIDSLSCIFPVADVVLYAKKGAPTPYLEGQS
jgi:hypothetical protein